MPSAPRPAPLPALLLILAAGVCAFPWPLFSPAMARYQIELGLALGVVLALAGLVRSGPVARRTAALVIQACVVLLGLRMDLGKVAHAGMAGLAFAAATISGVFVLGWALGRLLKTEGVISTLLSSGTAICGGSAIAAVGSVIGAGPAQMSVATATVFILNGIGLYLFPVLGHKFGLSPEQFGTWAGIAIHDVSSVVGAAQSYGHDAAATAVATETATVVKLSRVIWIGPICILAAWRTGRRAASDSEARFPAAYLPVPWFIVLFAISAGARTIWGPHIAPADPSILLVSRCGMALALFLIGAGLSRAALLSVGWRPLLQGVLMWVALGAAALVAVRSTVQP
jgi:uncharacterized integral membrane protein (TIGR00698 family)